MMQVWERQDEISALREKRNRSILSKEELAERKKDKIMREIVKNRNESNSKRNTHSESVRQAFQEFTNN